MQNVEIKHAPNLPRKVLQNIHVKNENNGKKTNNRFITLHLTCSNGYNKNFKILAHYKDPQKR